MREFAGQMPGTKIGTHSLCEPAGSKCTWTSHKSHFMRIHRKKSTPQDRAQFVQFCASQNALGQAARAILFFALMCQKNAAPKDRAGRTVCAGLRKLKCTWTNPALFVRACAVEMHWDKSQKPFCVRIYREKSRVPKCRGRLSGDCAAETHMDIAEQENAGDQMEHPDQAPALTLSVRTPCGHPAWGKTTPTVVQQGMSRPFSCLPIHVAVQELKTSLRVAGVTTLCGEDLCSHGKLKGFSVYPKVLHFGIV